MIITTKGYYSFGRKGDLKRLQKSKKYVPAYMQLEEIKNAAEKIGLKKGAKGKALEMAKKLKKKVIDIDVIPETSVLSKEEIEKL